MIPKGIKELCAEAEAEMRDLVCRGSKRRLKQPDTKLVDIRDIRELWREGSDPGRYSRSQRDAGVLGGSQSPYQRNSLRRGKIHLLLCWRDEIRVSCQTVQNMGLKPLAHMAGGYSAWVKAGGETEEKNLRIKIRSLYPH